MDLLFAGIKIGLILCFLIGPLFFALVQTGVEQGLRAGTMVGLGIWISDLLFILAVYWGVSYVNKLVQWEGFSLVLGLGGSILLMAFGLAALITRPSFDKDNAIFSKRTSSYYSLWLKGFLINTINPFTFFFWLGLMGTSITDSAFNSQQATLFFGGILATIVTTDFTKVLLAKIIQRKLNFTHLIWLRRISGAALIIFGIVLLVRIFVGG